MNALLVKSHEREAYSGEHEPTIWRHPKAKTFADRLFPRLQVWVHVDFRGYRSAFRRFGLEVEPDLVLDHVQNRKAIRLQCEIAELAFQAGLRSDSRRHQLLRLCPVNGVVNTSAGVNRGGEGMERQYLAMIKDELKAASEEGREPSPVAMNYLSTIGHDIIYADPFDLTKMLDIATGTFTLPGVRDTQELFYPPVG